MNEIGSQLTISTSSLLISITDTSTPGRGPTKIFRDSRPLNRKTVSFITREVGLPNFMVMNTERSFSREASQMIVASRIQFQCPNSDQNDHQCCGYDELGNEKSGIVH